MLFRLVLSLTSIGLLSNGAPAQEKPAQEKSPYKTLGAPTRPKVDARFNRYHDYAEASKLFADLAAAHPKFAKLQSLGKSYGGRDMWLLTVTNFAQGASAHKRRRGR